MSESFGKWLVLTAYCAILFVLVRPGSQGPNFVAQVADGMSNIVNASTGGGGWAAK